jgi:hypothetical protein
MYTQAMYWICVLESCTGAVYWSYVLELCTGSMYWGYVDCCASGAGVAADGGDSETAGRGRGRGEADHQETGAGLQQEG